MCIADINGELGFGWFQVSGQMNCSCGFALYRLYEHQSADTPWKVLQWFFRVHIRKMLNLVVS